jgi:alkanesulfonate monooxygenase SsuD/methylene tetrahydromethanopterin reductase-like flavin-dependent oxidoreductase (luciferase family)
MRFGINFGGGDLPGEPRQKALDGRLAKARLANQLGYHSLWTGAGYLNNDSTA